MVICSCREKMSEDGAEFIDLSRDDEDFVTCQICFTNFDEGEHVPKYLECKHVFCLTCIKVMHTHYSLV